MADDVTIDSVTYAADDISGVLYPRVKITHGANNTAVDASAANPLPVHVEDTLADGAAFTAGTTPVFPGGFVQRATPTTHDDGDVGAARMDSRQRILTAGESFILRLRSADPTPGGSDITSGSGGSTALTSNDFQIRDTNTHIFWIPLWASRRWAIGLQNSATWDQSLTVTVAGAFSPGTFNGSMLLSFAMPLTNGNRISIGEGAVGVGGVTGVSTATNAGHYQLNALFPWLYFTLRATQIPATGNIELHIWRQS